MPILFLQASYDSPVTTILIFSLLALAIYFMPTLVALLRNHHRKWIIIPLNVLGGWTIVGWIAALVWSFTTVKNDYFLKRQRDLRNSL